MLPDLDSLVAGYELYARQNRFAPERDEVRLADALREAVDLSAGKEIDETAGATHLPRRVVGWRACHA